MVTDKGAPPGGNAPTHHSSWRDNINLWDGVPFYLLIALLVVIFLIQPNALSVTGLTLLLSASIPLVLASVAQMFIITCGEIDLGIGSFTGLVNVIAAVVVARHPLMGVLLFIALIAAYVLLGLLIHFRTLPGIVVTLGASFVWLGVAIQILPTPGGEVPSAIINFFDWSPPYVPGPIIFMVIIAVLTNFLLYRSRYGSVLRGAGSNADAISHAGWSVAMTKGVLFGLAGLCAVLAGLALSANTTSGDPNNGASFVLLSIVAVIIGGGEFSGGIVKPAGAVAGAVVVDLISSLLTFLHVSSNYQIGVQGLVLILALAVRAIRARYVKSR